MPYRPPGRATGNRIELSIPVRLVRDAVGGSGEDADDDDDTACYICANAFCDNEDCCRTLTHLGCCTQAICCGCLLRQAKRCMCKDDCDAVIALCPFCREVSAVEVLDIFLGGVKACASCVKADPPPPTPAPRPAAAEVIDLTGDDD